MPQNVDILKCYETLDIPPGAVVEQVRKSYVALAHVWDPARHVNNPPLRQLAERKRKEIDAAYAALCEFLPDLRRDSDAESSEPGHVRPTDAIGDQIVHTPPPGSRAVMLGVIAAVLVIVLVLMGWSMWLDIRVINCRPRLAVAGRR